MPRSSTRRAEGWPSASVVASTTGAVSIWCACARSTAFRNSVIGSALAIIVLHPSSADGHDSAPSAPLSFTLEGVMKQVLIIIPLAAAAATSACVPATYGPGLAAMPPYAYRPPVYGAGVPVASLPVARWENVMMLPGRASIDVLTADGRRTSAAFVSATNTILRVRAGSSEIDIAAGSVVRIDRWFGGAAGSESVARDAA